MCCVLKFIFRFYNFNVTSCYIFQFSAVSTHCIFYLLEHTNRHYFKATNDQLSREKDEKEAIFRGRLAKRFQISAIQPHAQQAPHSRNGLSIRFQHLGESPRTGNGGSVSPHSWRSNGASGTICLRLGSSRNGGVGLSRGSHSRTCGGFQPLRGWKEWILTDTLISALATTPCLTYQHESCPGDIFTDGTFTFYLNLQKL